MKDRKHIWYHCSDRDRGPVWTVGFTRPVNVSPKEPPTPRLAAARSVAQCFAARLFNSAVTVYRTERPRASVKPIGVYDAVITGERWLVPPVRMVRIETIGSDLACDISRLLYNWIARHRRGPTPLQRLYVYQRAIELLGPKYYQAWEPKFVAKGIELFEAREELCLTS